MIYSVGAQTDRRMGIPGEDLPGSWSATDFVAWYNGHPDHQHLHFDLSGERAVVIGNGNVAVDVARMLALTPEELAPTDTTDAAMAAIGGSGIHEILMVGRRGPVQAAFTNPELLELGELAGADVIVDPADLELDPASAAALDGDTNAERNLQVLREYAAREPEGKPKRVVLRFLLSPVALAGRRAGRGRRARAQPARAGRPRRPARGPDRRAGDACRPGSSFAAWAIAASRSPGVPFDEERGVIRNVGGRVLDEDGTAGHGRLRRRLDQARPLRRHRHEQEGRHRDGRAAARGRP